VRLPVGRFETDKGKVAAIYQRDNHTSCSEIDS
jgi:hypothetical protein